MTASGYAALAYLAEISLVSAIVCAADKALSKRRGARRVPEAALLWLCALGGAAAMLITMLMIRHKTKKAKFMLTLPLMVAAHIAILWALRQTGAL